MKEEEPERLFTGEMGKVFVALTLMATIIKGGRYVIPPLLPSIIDQLSITASTAGTALTMMMMVFAVAQFPSGSLSDQLTRKTLILASVACSLVGFAVLATSSAYAAFLVGVLFVGLGDGLYSSPARARLSDLYERRRGQAFSIHMMSLDVAGAAASGLAVAVLAVAVWQSAFLPLIALLAVSTVLYWRWDREAIELHRVPLDAGDTVARIFTVPRLRLLVLAYSLYMFVLQGVLGFLPTFLRVEQGFSPVLASGMFALLFAVGLAVRPVAGWISDRASKPLVSAGALVIAVAGLVLVVFADVVALVVLGVIVLAAGQKAFSPAMQAYFMDLFPEGSRGGDYGGVRTTYFVVGSLGPAYAGIVADRLDFTVAFAGFVACLFVAAALVGWVVYRT